MKYVQCLTNFPYFTGLLYYSEIHCVQTQVVAGGDASNPVNIDGLVEAGNSFRLPVIQKAGPGGCLSFPRIQIGGGEKVYFSVDAGSIQFPRRADLARRDIQYHAADNAVGLSLAGKSGDTIKLTNSLVSSPTPFYFEINSAATSAATWDLTGTAIVGGTVTLRNVMTFDGMSFTSCPSLDFTGCTVTNAKISGVPAGNDTLTTNASTIIALLMSVASRRETAGARLLTRRSSPTARLRAAGALATRSASRRRDRMASSGSCSRGLARTVATVPPSTMTAADRSR